MRASWTDWPVVCAWAAAVVGCAVAWALIVVYGLMPLAARIAEAVS